MVQNRLDNNPPMGTMRSHALRRDMAHTPVSMNAERIVMHGAEEAADSRPPMGTMRSHALQKDMAHTPVSMNAERIVWEGTNKAGQQACTHALPCIAERHGPHACVHGDGVLA